MIQTVSIIVFTLCAVVALAAILDALIVYWPDMIKLKRQHESLEARDMIIEVKWQEVDKSK